MLPPCSYRTGTTGVPTVARRAASAIQRRSREPQTTRARHHRRSALTWCEPGNTACRPERQPGSLALNTVWVRVWASAPTSFADDVSDVLSRPTSRVRYLSIAAAPVGHSPHRFALLLVRENPEVLHSESIRVGCAGERLERVQVDRAADPSHLISATCAAVRFAIDRSCQAICALVSFFSSRSRRTISRILLGGSLSTVTI